MLIMLVFWLEPEAGSTHQNGAQNASGRYPDVGIALKSLKNQKLVTAALYCALTLSSTVSGSCA